MNRVKVVLVVLIVVILVVISYQCTGSFMVMGMGGM